MTKSYIRQSGGIEVIEGTNLPKSVPFGFKEIKVFANSVEVITDNEVFSLSVTNDAITLTDGLFSGTPTQLGTKLRDLVFFKANPGTGGSGTTTNASDLTSGTLADARLSSNVPIKVAGKIQAADLPSYTLNEVTDGTNRLALTTAERAKLAQTSGANTGDQDLSGLVAKANNLSDLASAPTARTNLGLGSLSTQNGTFSGTSSGTNTGDETTARINALYGYTPANAATVATNTANIAALTPVKQTHTTGAAVTVSDTTTWLVVNPATTLAALAVTLPAAPSDMQLVQLSFGGTLTSGNVVTNISVLPNTGQTLIQSTTPTNVEAGEATSYRYNSTNSIWYRIL